jgi:hypothetical protein
MLAVEVVVLLGERGLPRQDVGTVHVREAIR